MMKNNLLKVVVMSFAVLASTVFLLRPPTASSISAAPAGSAIAEDGVALFSAKCSICHDKSGKGNAAMKSKGVPDFTDPGWQRAHTDAQIAEAIKKGGKTMPSFNGKLSDAQLAAIVARVRSFGRR